MRFVSMLQAVSLVVPVLSGAQTAATSDWPPASGARVRIQSPLLGDKKQTGTVISATPDTLFFYGQSGDRFLSTSQIARIEIARGTHTRGRKGLAIGLLVGAALGAATAAATYEPSGSYAVFDRGGAAALGGGFGGIVGAIIGGLAGMQLRETWVPLDVPRRVAAPTDHRQEYPLASK